MATSPNEEYFEFDGRDIIETEFDAYGHKVFVKLNGLLDYRVTWNTDKAFGEFLFCLRFDDHDFEIEKISSDSPDEDVAEEVESHLQGSFSVVSASSTARKTTRETTDFTLEREIGIEKHELPKFDMNPILSDVSYAEFNFEGGSVFWSKNPIPEANDRLQYRVHITADPSSVDTFKHLYMNLHPGRFSDSHVEYKSKDISEYLLSKFD